MGCACAALNTVLARVGCDLLECRSEDYLMSVRVLMADISAIITA